MAGLAVTQVIGWGTSFYPIAIIGRAVQADLGLSRELTFFGLTVMLMVSAFIAPRIGRALDYNGPRTIMMIGSVLAGASLLIVGAAPNLTIYLVGWAIAGVMMPMALTLSAFTAITQVMGDGTRRAVTLLTFFTGVASTVFWPLIDILQPWLGWRTMLMVFALAHIIICLPIHAFVLPSKADHDRRLRGLAGSEAMQGVLTPERRWRGLVLTALTTSLHGVIGWGLALHFIEMFKALGLPPGAAVAIASLNGVMQVSARFTDFAFGGKYSPLGLGLVAVALQPFAFIGILGFGATTWTATLFIVGYGISAGLMTIVRASMPLYLFGREFYGSYAGRLTLPQNIIFGISPVIFAAILDRSGPVLALSIALGASLLSVAAMISLARAVEHQRGK